MHNQTPIYNLKVVLIETGLKPDVLRAWERRYDLPKPQRSAGGHRLYSDYDIAVIKWLKSRQADGLSISHAVDLWKEISASGKDPLEENFADTPGSLGFPHGVDTRIEELRNRWLEACLKFNNSGAENILNQAFALYPVETVCVEILQRGLSEIGQLWYEDKITVQQEHFTSAISIRRLETMVTAVPAAHRGQTLLIGCPAGEWHTFPVLLLKLFLRRKGWEVVYLGGDNPTDQLVATAREIKPDLVVLSAQHIFSAAALLVAGRSLRELGIPLGYGGMIFNRMPVLREKIPAIFLGETIEAGISSVERLLKDQLVIPIPEAKLNQHHELVVAFHQKRTLIEQGVLDQLNQDGLATDYLLEANNYFGSGLEAAIEFGSPAFLEADLNWVSRLLSDRRIPTATLRPFMMAYSHSVRIHMGEVGAQITGWIDGYIKQNGPIDELRMENDEDEEA